MMPVSIFSFLLSSYVLTNYVTSMPVVSTSTQTTLSGVSSTTPALEGNKKKIADTIVKIRMIGNPKESEEDIRMEVEKKIREENITELSQVFTTLEFNFFCSLRPNACSGTQYSNWK